VATKPEHRKLWTWVSIVVIPTVIAVGIALYSARLSLDQAGEQEARAQDGANQAADAKLAKEPALLARVRPLRDDSWAWVFPDALDEPTRLRLFEPERDIGRVVTDDADQPKRDAGGLFADSRKFDGEWKSTSRHLVSLVGNRRQRVRVLDIRAHVLEKLPPLLGTVLYHPGQGGTNPVERVGLDLDDPARSAVLMPEPSLEEPPPAARPFLDVKSVDLAEGEELGVDVTAFTKEHIYRWELELTVSYEGVTTETVVVRSDGTATGTPFTAAAWGWDWPYRGGFHSLRPVTGGGTTMVREN
jgi:hypothetical protein